MMTRCDAGVVLGIAGFLMGGSGLYLGWRALDEAERAHQATSSDEDLIAALGAQARELKDDLGASEERATSLATALEDRRREIANLAHRIAELEKR